MILSGKPVQERVLAEVKAGVERLKQARGVTPTLGVVLIGEDPASQVYVRGKKRAADSVGIATRDALYPQGIGQRELMDLLRALSTDRSVHGILLQLPLLGETSKIPKVVGHVRHRERRKRQGEFGQISALNRGATTRFEPPLER